MSLRLLTLLLISGFSVLLAAPHPGSAQETDTDKGKQEEAVSEKDTAAVETVRKAEEDSRLRFRLWDGTVILGNPTIRSLPVRTRFGLLDVPLEGIVNIRPGIGSLPDLKARVDRLLELLEDREFQKRRTASEELLAMGPVILNYLKEAPTGASAERKKMMETIIAELSEQADELSDDPVSDRTSLPLMVEDSVSAGDFVVVGVIEEKVYTVSTDYGTLTIPLSTIRIVERSGGTDTRIVRKKLDVSGMGFFQTTPENTGIRVRRGDRVRIRAEGTVQWTNWGNVACNPDGIATHGQWNGMNCGMLVARIGDRGDYIPIGQEKDFIAADNGELILGVAMNDNFATQKGYQWQGDYAVQIVVEGIAGD